VNLPQFLICQGSVHRIQDAINTRKMGRLKLGRWEGDIKAADANHRGSSE
jgi:hypothetical protein